MIYSEPLDFTKEYRENYLYDILSFTNNLVKQNVETNNKIINSLGYPLNIYKKEAPKVDKKLLSKEDGFNLYRLTVYSIAGIRFTGLYFEKNISFPLIITQHGMLGTPEVMSNIYPDRNTYNYCDIVKRLLTYNVNIFCPQLLMWSVDNYGVDYNRMRIDSDLREKGSSIFALETYGIQKALDYFESIGIKEFKMFGMSYGAAYTYRVMAVEKRLKAGFANSFVLSNNQYPDMLFGTLPFAELFKEAAKTKLFISLGLQDPIVKIPDSLDLVKETADDSTLEFETFEGDHIVTLNDDFINSFISF